MLEPKNPRSSPKTNQVTRLAPSPTGALHLGNLRTFVINWVLARQRGWKVVMRIEDLDGPRIKPQSITQILDLLKWIGLDYEPPILRQSENLEPYRNAMRTITKKKRAYPCALTRSEIAAARSAPHLDDHETHFPVHLRPDIFPTEFNSDSSNSDSHHISLSDSDSSNWRFAIPDQTITFKDQFHGPTSSNPAKTIGDFVIWTKQGLPAYQLAVVVDDARQKVTQIVRGDDLLDSTARQIHLIQSLNIQNIPTYHHLPLILGPDGHRLAKRHGDTRVALYRELGTTPERVLGLLAYWSGITPRRTNLSLMDFIQSFDLSMMSHQPVTMTPDDDDWLRAKSS